MYTKFKSLIAATLITVAMIPGVARAIGWPAGHEGVMLQGFYWDSYTDTRWTNIEANADEYSKYFNLIWIPNSGKAGSGNQMGYMPQYWFTNHNSSFGTEAQLLSMIAKYKEKGVGFIADCVINHRNGVTNWADFPVEEWNGTTWKIGLDGICCNDELNGSGHGTPTGAPDTGENFDGCRDLDHTNANVQNNCKNYVKCLQEKYGYAGMRYDMVKGYGGQYTKIYNQYANVTYSVGEYWDSSFDAVAAWIDATGKTSAAFDFPLKYVLNEAFTSGDMTKLVWKAYGTNDQPAGLIHAIYPQYAVTFVDNHDTYRDGSKFTGNVVAANAFILLSPGTPCVFLPHYKQHKAAIQTLINVRNACGISNTSKVTVLKSSRDCYMAEITGSKGKAVVKVGSAMDSPAGYTSADIKASGDGYCVWTKTDVSNPVNPGLGGGDGPIDPPQTGNVVIYFDNSASHWATPHIHYWGASESKWPGVAMAKVSGGVWKYECPEGTTGCLFNAGDGDATKTTDFTAIHNHIYTTAGDQGVYSGAGDDPVIGNTPSRLYLMGNYEGGGWSPDLGIEMTRNGDKFTANSVTIVAAEDSEYGYISFSTALGATADTSEWATVNASNRYGATANNATLAGSAPMRLFAVNVDASSCYSWAVTPGTYNVTADFATMTVTIDNSTGIAAIEADDEVSVRWFTLQGIEVSRPTPGGIYIRLIGNRAVKVAL